MTLKRATITMAIVSLGLASTSLGMTVAKCTSRPTRPIAPPALDITPLLEPIQEAGRMCQAAYGRAQENASQLATQRAQIDDLRCVLMYQFERMRKPVATHAWRADWPGFEQCASCNSGHRCNVAEEP